MEPAHKKTLKAISLELRHLLEGWYDASDTWHAGDLEQRLAAIGLLRDRNPVPADELPHLTDDDRYARKVVDAYIEIRRDAGIKQPMAVAEFVSETAYTWANRLLALRCMEARELIDEVILQKEVYGGRSLEHHRLAQRQPELCAGDDDGLFAILDKVFTKRSETLPLLFNPKSPGIALKPTAAALKRCIALLSGTTAINGQKAAEVDVFKAADALGWAYQYWNTEEKDRVFDKVRTQKGSKIEGSDIIPATQLYTEPYMVKFLVQNSLGATWFEMRRDTKLTEDWEYFIRDVDRVPIELKPVQEITFIDPACGSGHFLIEAFDLFYDMYKEEGDIVDPEDICRLILEKNLYGIDIDERALQIAEAALWMKAAEKEFDFAGRTTNLVATNIRLPKKRDHLKAFLQRHPDDEPLRPALEVIFESLEHADELGSLLQIEEPVEKELRYLQQSDPLFQHQTAWGAWKRGVISRLKEHFVAEAESADLSQAFFSQSAGKGLALLDLLAQRYDVVAANPPYMHNRNMGSGLRTALRPNYPMSSMDLYSSFIDRCVRLTKEQALSALVSQQSFMFLSSYDSFRQYLLENGYFELVSHLGSGAFSEISGEKVNVALLLYRRGLKDEALSLFIDVKEESNKSASLSLQIQEGLHSSWYRCKSTIFKVIKGAPFVYWIDPLLLEMFKRKQIDDGSDHCAATIKGGISTTDNSRFLRYFWETPVSNRWHAYRKGGGFCRWYGNSEYRVDWEHEGLRLKNLVTEQHGNPGKHLRNMSFFQKDGLTYSLMCGDGFSVRYLPENCVFDNSGPSIFAGAIPLHVLAIYLNSDLVRYITKMLNPTMSVQSGDVGRIPQPKVDTHFSKDCALLAGHCLVEKKIYLESNLTDDMFVAPVSHHEHLAKDLNLTCLNALVEPLIFVSQGINLGDMPDFVKRCGIPISTMPYVNGHCDISDTIQNLKFELGNTSALLLSADKKVNNETEITLLKKRLSNAYQSGPGKMWDESEKWDVPRRGKTETFLEELSIFLGIHPLSVYSLLKEGIENEGWLCLPEERRITADRFTVIIMHLLGYLWPKEIETGKFVPEWADENGIIPLTDGTSEKMLIDRIHKRITVEFESSDIATVERAVTETMGKPLYQWLESEFFKHHVKQFKKRPIAWQIQSGKYNRKKKPAFACFVYYHKLDHDTLPKIRTQYVGPLRQRYETELRGIETVSIDARSERQDKRRIELESLISELIEFDSTLQKTIKEAFSSKNLGKHISKEKLDKWCSIDGIMEEPLDKETFFRQESQYVPDINDGVRVNIAPLQKAGLLAADVLSKKDVDKAISDRAEWRYDERRWCREGKLPQPGWWSEEK